MKLKFFSVISFLFSLSLIFGFAQLAAADCNCLCDNGAKTTISDEAACRSFCEGLPQSEMKSCGPIGIIEDEPEANAPTVKLDNPLGSIDSPQVLIGNIINSVLGVVGSLALLMFVFGGITWMTSSGSQEKVKKGRDIIIWSVLGLAIIFLSYALTRFILSTIVQ
jgi:hypothetical protein